MSHTDLCDVDATSSGVSLETTITNLPDVVLSSIFQHLFWKEKIMAVEAFPAWNRILDSNLGWKHFVNDRNYPHSFEALKSTNYLSEEITCIAQYGQFFTHAVIWLKDFLPPDNPEESDFHLLEALETHCFHLKSLVIYHPPAVSSSSFIRSGALYIQPLKKMFSFLPSLQLSLYRLLYFCKGSEAGVFNLLHFYHTHNVLQKVSCLDFSYGLRMASSVRPMNCLVYCTSLRVLKCPIQYLDTLILQQLLEFSLQELYVISDDHTLSLNYDESAIEWHALQLLPGRNLKVHYVFRQRSAEICSNPYARSLVFDSLICSISRALLMSIANMYGATLEHIAFMEANWNPPVTFSGLDDLPTNIQYLASRLTCVHTVLFNHFIHKVALISLATHAPALKTLLVYEHKIMFDRHAVNTVDEIEELKSIISEALGYSWKPVKEYDTFYKLAGYRQNLLFEDISRQLQDFW